MNIPDWPQADGREIELLRAVLDSTQWGGFHPYVRHFELDFARYQHADDGISAANGTLTLELALLALGIGPGDEVIVPAISFISTATAVSRVGALPVFVDIEERSFNLDPAGLPAALSSRTRAVIPVHFGGSLCRLDAVLDFCHEQGLFLIEDAAHAHGSEWSGKRAGSFGVCGSFSFQNGKVLSAGEGGILITSHADFAERARSVANQGRLEGRDFFEHHRLGTNFRLTAFQAAVLMAQLERLDEQIERRTANALRLRTLVPDGEQVWWQTEPPQVNRNSQYLLLGRVRSGREARDRMCRRLLKAGVPCTPFYPHTLYQNPLYQQPGSCHVLPCPNSEACIEDAFWLAHRVLLADADTIEEVATLIREALAEDVETVTVTSEYRS
jgi:dTDP-4-amino-4,6-dideoxygalactose transaminase